jgi:hypothetical protein
MSVAKRWGETKVRIAETVLKWRSGRGKQTDDWWVPRWLRSEVLGGRAETLRETYPGQRICYGEGWAKQLLGVQLRVKDLSAEELVGLARAHCNEVREIRLICGHRAAGAYVQLQSWALYREQQLAGLAAGDARAAAGERGHSEDEVRADLCEMLVWSLLGWGEGRTTKGTWAHLVGWWGRRIDSWGVDELGLAYELIHAAAMAEADLWMHGAHDLLCAVDALSGGGRVVAGG